LITGLNVVDLVFESTLWLRQKSGRFNVHIIDSIDAFHCMTVAFLPIICENMIKLALTVLPRDAMATRKHGLCCRPMSVRLSISRKEPPKIVAELPCWNASTTVPYF